MLYLAMFNWLWLLASALIGLAMGWIAVVHRGRGWSNVTMQKIGVFVAALIIASALHLAPGRFGYWLIRGSSCSASISHGCAVGSWLRNLVVSRDMPAS